MILFCKNKMCTFKVRLPKMEMQNPDILKIRLS